MLIQIDNKNIRLGVHCFAYSAYYLDDNAPGEFTSVDFLKKVLVQWKRSVTENLANECILFLPFSLEDEYVECFKANLNGGQLSLTHVLVAENGYALPIQNLNEFILSSHEIREESDELFGPLSVQEFIDGLSAALDPSRDASN
jgi:hypothetical protein